MTRKRTTQQPEGFHKVEATMDPESEPEPESEYSEGDLPTVPKPYDPEYPPQPTGQVDPPQTLGQVDPPTHADEIKYPAPPLTDVGGFSADAPLSNRLPYTAPRVYPLSQNPAQETEMYQYYAAKRQELLDRVSDLEKFLGFVQSADELSVRVARLEAFTGVKA